jgi:hypothetical protein
MNLTQRFLRQCLMNPTKYFHGHSDFMGFEQECTGTQLCGPVLDCGQLILLIEGNGPTRLSSQLVVVTTSPVQPSPQSPAGIKAICLTLMACDLPRLLVLRYLIL